MRLVALILLLVLRRINATEPDSLQRLVGCPVVKLLDDRAPRLRAAKADVILREPAVSRLSA